jgi:uncharacterized protein YjbI with pentapeptide repeats
LLLVIDREPLVLVTGYSGTGKTSLLRAAFVPRLRIERSQAILNDGDKTARPAILVVRDWLMARQEGHPRHYDEILKEAIVRSIEALPKEVLPAYREEQYKATWEITHRDFKDMSRVDKSGTAYHYITGLAEAVGSLLLCIDQFEEVLQGSVEQRIGMLDTIAHLVKQRKFNVKILLSFRQEFSFLFQRLDRQVGNLAQATVYLEQMPEAAVRVAVLESAKSGGVSLSEGALNKLLKWMQEMYREQGLVEMVSILPDEATSGKLGESTSIDLLRLQALLQELYQLASKTTKARGRVTITETTVDRLLKQEQRVASRDLKGSELMHLALSLFIERRVLPPTILKSSSTTGNWVRLNAVTGLPRNLNASDRSALINRLQQRRVAARMAPLFSSLGLKVQQYEAHLISSALREEWDTLEIPIETIEDFLTSFGLKDSLTRLHELKWSKTNLEIARTEPVLSGETKTNKKWTYSDALKYFLEISLTTLDRLVEFNILRPKTARQGIVYELVHDGFGPALFEWSEKVRNDPLDTLGAVIAQRGESFGWNQLGGDVTQVCWRGCWVGPGAGSEELLFDNVRWDGCDLRGTFFHRCHFRGGSFRRCDLDGVIFRNCRFTAAPDKGERFEFRSIEADGLDFLGGSLNDVDFIDCSLKHMRWDHIPNEQKLQISNVTFKGCQPLYQWSILPAAVTCPGHLRLYNCNLELCDLRYLPYEDDRGKSKLDIRDCKFNYSLLGKALAHFIDRSNSNRRSPKLRGMSI